MTFDPKAFLEFCRSKPAGKRYPAGHALTCALAQFGFPSVVFPNSHGIPEGVYNAALNKPWTFGALASRLASTLAEPAARLAGEE